MYHEKSSEAQIREKLGTEVSSLLKAFIDKRVKEREIRFFNGKVVNNNDPLKEGRCQIRVYGKYTDEIPDDDLPWATPDFNFIGSKLGSLVVPPIDGIVKVYFDNDDFYNPRYSTKTFDRTSFNFSALDVNDDYPDTMIFFETDRGEFFKINRKTGKTTYRHVSGVLVEFDKDGNLTYDSTASETGDVNFNVKGNLNLSVLKDFNLTAGGSINIEAINPILGSIVIKSPDTAIQGTQFLRLRFPGFATWFPNALPVDLFTNAPHGGTGAGQVSLVSEAPQ